MATKSINKSIVIETQEQLDKFEATLEKVAQSRDRQSKKCAIPANVKVADDNDIRVYFG